jgi:hypothetical protein
MLVYANPLQSLFFWGGFCLVSLSVSAVVELKYLVYNSGCPRLVCQSFCVLSCIARARLWVGGCVMDRSYDLFHPLHQTLVLRIRSISFGL